MSSLCLWFLNNKSLIGDDSPKMERDTMANFDFDLIVLGGGSGGVRLS